MLRGKHNKECIAFPVGAKILMKELILSVGGGGTNSAVSLSRLGYKVAFIGKIGSKYNSERVIEQLNEEKVNTSLIIRSKRGRTGYSIVLDSLNHDRTILTFRGSNSELRYREINLKRLKTKWFYFSSMIGTSFKTLEKLSDYAYRNKIKISFNLSSYLAKKGIPKLKNILKKIDILVLNKDEAQILIGNHDIKTTMIKLNKLGPETVAITDGKRNVNIFNDGYIYSGKPNKIKIIETTGAGDAFASSFLCGIIKKNDIQFAMRLGIANAESVIQHHGSKENLLRYNEVLRAMKRRPIKIIKRKIN